MVKRKTMVKRKKDWRSLPRKPVSRTRKVMVRLTPAEYEQLAAQAVAANESMAGLVRLIVAADLRARREGTLSAAQS